jgi:hypothetical protein
LQPSETGRVPVPKLKGDPVWALKPWPVIIQVAGVEYEIPALPAADWLAILMADPFDPDDLILSLVVNGKDLLFAETVSADDLEYVCLDIITTASARPWWIALRLIAMARANWSVLGAELILKGVNPAQISLAAWLDALLLTALKNMDSKDVTMFTMKLEEPPPEEMESVAEEMEMSADSFLSLGF